jgi:NAD+-dependent protein deacetylase sirtuin 4
MVSTSLFGGCMDTIKTGLASLVKLMQEKRVVVLTGAGCSTESGIPDYRGPETRLRAKSPVKFQAFVGDDQARRRYWSRSFIGWPKLCAAPPNQGHQALASLEQSQRIMGILTQNVDGLHQAAGSKTVIELHGNLAEVFCLQCGKVEPRSQLQERLRHLNPSWELFAKEILPDGDAELSSEQPFRVANCLLCNGDLKPAVVFFGENMQTETRRAADQLFAEAEALLVVGSSLAVFSGYRFVHQASKRQLPIAVINVGEMMRGEELVGIRINAAAGEVLGGLHAALSPA